MKYSIKFVFFLLVATCWLCGCSNNDGDAPTPDKFTPRYRGIHMYGEVGVPVPDADIDKVGTWGVNHVRWWFVGGGMTKNNTPETYRQFITEQCDILDTKLPVFERNGIKVCLVLGSYPGGLMENMGEWPPHKIFYSQDWEDEFVRTWEYIARRYKGNETLVMYDLMNEPNQGLNTNQPAVFLRAAQAIRAIGDDTEIVFEAASQSLYESIQPFDLPGIIYSIHVYNPHLLTHQGVSMRRGAVYPGDIDNVYWTKNRLRDHYRPVKRFSNKHHVRIYVGEFGCARWAPENSAYNYIRDCLEYFEEEGWDYTYFSLQPTPEDCSYTNQGATTWSPEYGVDYPGHCPVGNTDRLELLKSFWARNKQ
jgi:hypothetical protein